MAWLHAAWTIVALRSYCRALSKKLGMVTGRCCSMRVIVEVHLYGLAYLRLGGVCGGSIIVVVGGGGEEYHEIWLPYIARYSRRSVNRLKNS